MSIIEKLIRKQEKLLNREEENYRLLKFEFQRCHDEKKNQEKRIADLQAASGGDSGPVPDGDELRAAQKELKEIKEEMAIIKPKLDGSETTIQDIKDALNKLLKDLRAAAIFQLEFFFIFFLFFFYFYGDKIASAKTSCSSVMSHY